MDDVLDWLRYERDREAAAREKAFKDGDNATANSHNERCGYFFDAICEIEKSRARIRVFSEVLQRRIILAAKENGISTAGLL